MPQLNRADVEFYESHMVMVSAKAMMREGEVWEALLFQRRQVLLNRAVSCVQALLADETIIERFGYHYRRHVIALATTDMGAIHPPAGSIPCDISETS